jgi:diguanylate cyclase (GGDEF)-like protein
MASTGSRAIYDHHAALPRTGLWPRLTALVLVPFLGIGVFAVQAARERSSSASRASHAAASVQAAHRLLDLVFALDREVIVLTSPVLTSAPSLAIEPAVAAALAEALGTDVSGARDATDRALVALPSGLTADHVELAELAPQLAVAREQADAAEPGPFGVRDAYLPITTRLRALVRAELTRMLDDSHALPGSVASNATQALNETAPLALATSDLWFDLLEVALPRTSIEAAVRDLVDTRASMRAAESDLDQVEVSVIKGTWDILRALPVAIRVQRHTSDAINDPDAFADRSMPDLAAVFTDVLERSAQAEALTSTAAQLAEAAVEAERWNAERALLWTIVASVAIAVATLAIALLVARSVRRPLRRLARRAVRLREGDLTPKPIDRQGPREVVEVAVTLDEVVENLRHAEEQATALADGKLFAPCLEQPAPGLLGSSLQRSVAKLSESLRRQEELQQRLAHQALHDPLTSLPNRAGSLNAIGSALARARRSGQRVALLFVDLDGFKRVNDTHGHAGGDDLLREVSDRLKAIVREGDVVGRLGGDEFIVVAEPVRSEREAVLLGERLIDVISSPMHRKGRELRVGASVGLVLDHPGHVDGLAFLRDADVAVHRAKEAGKGRVAVYDEAVQRELDERDEVEEALRAAVRTDALGLVFQPIVDAVSGSMVGLEALVRWDRPGMGPVSPAHFVDVAEGSELVIDLDRWVLGRVAQHVAAWAEIPELASVPVAVNVSGRHLASGRLGRDVAEVLDASGIDPARLTLEITETVLVADLDAVVAHLLALRELGVSIALDDFGTGYTSLSQLCRIPIDQLKIDGSFVRNLDDLQQRSIVEVVIELATTLGVDLVAEGVEDDNQLATLRDLGCHRVQGFLVARPMRPEDIPAWVGAERVGEPGLVR